MMKTLLAAALVCTGALASAAPLTPDVAPNINLLSAGEYRDFSNFVDGNANPVEFNGIFDLIFRADDASRQVTVTLTTFTPSSLGDFGFQADGAAIFDTGAPAPQSEIFTLAKNDDLTLTIGEVFSLSPDKTEVGYQLDVTSTVVPLPAALPLVATGLAALGFVARRRRA